MSLAASASCQAAKEADLAPVKSQFAVSGAPPSCRSRLPAGFEPVPRRPHHVGSRRRRVQAVRNAGSRPDLARAASAERNGPSPACWSATAMSCRPASRSRTMARCGRWAAWSPLLRTAGKITDKRRPRGSRRTAAARIDSAISGRGANEASIGARPLRRPCRRC